MSAKVFESKEVQNLLQAAANLGSQDGNQRAKQITHRLLSDLFKAIDDLDMTPDEIWAGVHYFNKLGRDGEAALLAAGLGLEKYLDIRMDAGGELYVLDCNTNPGLFYPIGQFGNADLILDAEPEGHKHFLRHIIASALKQGQS